MDHSRQKSAEPNLSGGGHETPKPVADTSGEDGRLQIEKGTECNLGEPLSDHLSRERLALTHAVPC